MPGSSHTRIKQSYYLFSGSRSRHWFALFVLSCLFNVYMTDFFCYYQSQEFGWDWSLTIGSIEAAIFTIGVSGLSFMMVRLNSAFLRRKEFRNASTFKMFSLLHFLVDSFLASSQFVVC